MKYIPDEKQIEELLENFSLKPGLRLDHRLLNAPWTPRSVTRRRFVKATTFAVIVITLLVIATPQGRAWAQKVAQFFQRINSTTIQLSDEQTRAMNDTNRQYDLPLVPVLIPAVSSEMAAIPGCETPQKAQSYYCQVALSETKLGFNLKVPPEKTNDWEFESLNVNTDSQYAVMSFDLDFKYIGFASHSSLWLIQGVGDFSNFEWNKNNPWEAVPADKVEPVSIGVYRGEYVRGRFGLKPGNKVLTWFEDTDEQRLAWSEGTRWYLIIFSPNLNISCTMDKDKLIHLAESLVNSSIETSKPLDPDRLLSISDAEAASGLDLKSPTLLPMDMDFSYARYLPDEQKVQLIYGLNEELIIHEWKGDPVEYKKPLGKYEYTCKVVNMNGNDAFYCFYEGGNPRSFLWWHKNGFNYQIYYDPLLGGQIDGEKMLLIAESMQDIDDFSKNNKKSYEQIVLYEQALRMDIKKFPEVSAGWVFANFWGDASARCIDLMYTSTAVQGTLLINQCKTDKHSEVFAFPIWSTKLVNVGNTKGQYIVGGFIMTDDGKQVWDLTLPIKQLYWQEDGLWMQIALYGNATLQSNQGDLISYAESLK